MPRRKKLPVKKSADMNDIPQGFASNTGPVSSNSENSDVHLEGRPAKKRRKVSVTSMDILTVKAMSNINLERHLTCSTESMFGAFSAYIRVFQGIKSKYNIGHILINVNEDFSEDCIQKIYGIYVGEEAISILCITENAPTGTPEEKYYPASSSVPCEILCNLASKYFNIQYSSIPTPGALMFDVLLSEVNFPVISSPSVCPDHLIRTEVKKVVQFFSGNDITEKSPPDLQSNQDFSKLFDTIANVTTCDVNVQHPDLLPQLRPYQQHAVQWMLSREQKTGFPVRETPDLHPLFTKFTTLDGIEIYYNKSGGYFSLGPQYAAPPCQGGILADEMGLGKTVEVLACILNNPREGQDLELGTFNPERRDSEVTDSSSSSECVFSCVCGETDYDENDADLVKCHKCGILQHGRCFNYDLNSNDPYYCPHCWVDNSMELISSRATLIITPHRICYQWEDEIRKHVQATSLKILSYQGLGHHNFLPPHDFCEYDIVLTTYEVLRKELYYLDLPYSSRNCSLRRPQKFYSSPSPLPAILFWRICLDEAQMAENTTSSIAKMAQKLSSVHRWCVTGTPVQKNVNDLFGLLLFVGSDPYCFRIWWKEDIFAPFCNGNSGPLVSAFKSVLWRTMKKNVLDQIGIPRQNSEIHWVNFSPVEEYFYKEQSQNCLSAISRFTSSQDLNTSLKSLDKRFLCKVWHPVRILRQACCHPQVVKGSVSSQQKTYLSMNEVLDVMIRKEKYNCEDAHRQLVGALNGLAGICIISQNEDEAISYYKKAVSSAHAHEEYLRTDTIQVYHAFFNMVTIFSGNNVSSTSGSMDCNTCSENRENAESEGSTYSQGSDPSELTTHSQGSEESEEHVTSEDSQESTSTNSTESGPTLTEDKKIHPIVREPISWQRIADEAEKIKSSYLQKTLKGIENAKVQLDALNKEEHDLSSVLNSDAPWWIRVAEYATFADKDSAFTDKLISDLQAATEHGRSSISARFKDINGLCFVIEKQLEELRDSRNQLKREIESLPTIPSENDVVTAASCHLRRLAKHHSKIIRCKYCKVQEKFNKYESKLFRCTERTTQVPYKRAQELKKPHSDNSDEGGLSEEPQANPLGTRGTWADSELEKALKAFLVFGRNNQVESVITEEGNSHIQWMFTLKKEFRAFRNMWMRLSDHVAAVDELNMASQRFRLKVPSDGDLDPSVNYIIAADQVETMKQKLFSDKRLAKGKFKERLVKMFYLQNLKKLENERSEEENGTITSCPVCRLQLKSMWTILPCGHCVCNDCLLRLMKDCSLPRRPNFFRCPICREEVCGKDVFYIGKQEESEIEKQYPVQGNFSSKVTAIIRCLFQITQDDPSAKALIFSEWQDLLNILVSALEKNGIPFVSLFTKKKFQTDLLKFKENAEIKCALLPVHSCSSGLNIIEATHVLMAEPLLHPSWELQAIGRVHRIGQTKETTIHRFIVKDSIEEKVYSLLPTGCQPDEEIQQKESCLTLQDLKGLF